MFLSIHDNCPVRLIPEYEFEHDALMSENFQSKLAYEVLTDIQDGDFSHLWHLNYDADAFHIDQINQELIIPANLDPPAFCYALRIVVDGILLNYNCIPLHCAAVTSCNHQIFLFAKPQNGKSYFADYICKTHPDFSLIGDDHVVIGKNKIWGNTVKRMRNKEKETTSYSVVDKVIYDTFSSEHSIGISIEQSNQNEIHIVPRSDMYEYICLATGFKYLSTDPFFNGIRYSIDAAFGSNKVEQYRCQSISQLLNYGAFFHVTGSFEDIKEAVETITNRLLGG